MNNNEKTHQKVWNRCLDFIKNNISQYHFKTWFSPIIPIGLEKNILKLQVPSQFFYQWLECNYIELLKIAIQKELGKNAKLIYTILIKKENLKKIKSNINIKDVNCNKIKKEDISYIKNNIKNPFFIPDLHKIKIDPQLNSKLNFDNFIEGDFNRLARAAGQKISKYPGSTSFNPLFIYSNVGLGKTHLANAIGLKIKELNTNKHVLFVSSERFQQQFTQSVRNNTRNDFFHFYQMIDVLILDDIHFLSGKTSTQEIFFHLFNHLHRNNKQIILTSDKSPIAIHNIEERIISRFKWGLSADIQKPNTIDKKKILLQKLQTNNVQLENEIINYIASNIKKNIRELEGAVNLIIAEVTLNKKKITIELVKSILSRLISNENQEITIDIIQSLICNYFNIPIHHIQSPSRKRDIVQTRQLIMYFSKKYTTSSLSLIGNKIGKRDHTTVLHACKTIQNLSETDKNIKYHIEKIKEKIKFN